MCGCWSGSFRVLPALLAALMCGVMNFHIYWSRDAQDAAAPMFFVPLAFLLLDRGLIGEHRGYSVAAGLTIGFAQFFHPANRLLLPMAIAYLGYALVLRSWSAREISLAVWGTTLVSGFWTAAAVIVGHLPLIAYFEAHRVEFWSRTNEVSVLPRGGSIASRIHRGLGTPDYVSAIVACDHAAVFHDAPRSLPPWCASGRLAPGDIRGIRLCWPLSGFCVAASFR
ncbi:MAG: hypothetical protein R2839_02805 [Thermomicrobiales bacterium]